MSMPLGGNRRGGGGGSGTVTSVGLSLPGALFSVSGTPVTGTGTLAGDLLQQPANTVLAGPESGGDDAPTMRALVRDDLPDPAVTFVNNATSPYTVLSADETICCECAAGPVVLDIASQAPAAGRVITVKNHDGEAGDASPITIDSTGSGYLIDGLEQAYIVAPYGGLVLQGDGVNWNIIARTWHAGQFTIV